MGFNCDPINTTKQAIYMTAYPVSVRSVVDKTMEIEVLLQYYIFWQDTSADAGSDMDEIWKPTVVIQNAVEINWIVSDSIVWTRTDKIQAEVTGLSLTNMKLSGRAKFRVTNRGQWDLKDFPFDKRQMTLTIGNLQPVYTELTPFYYQGFSKSMTGKLPGIWIPTTDYELVSLENDETLGATDTVVQLQFSAKRKAYVYYETCMFPVACSSVVAYFGFYVPITIKMPRFATAIISLLTVASLKRTIEAKIPEAAVDCFLEKWLTFQMGLLMLCCVAHMAAFNRHEHRLMRKLRGLLPPGRTTHVPDIDLPLRFFLPIFFFGTVLQASLSSSGDATQEFFAWFLLLLWFIPLIFHKGVMRRCGCLFLLVGYDETGTHNDPWPDPCAKKTDEFSPDEPRCYHNGEGGRTDDDSGGLSEMSDINRPICPDSISVDGMLPQQRNSAIGIEMNPTAGESMAVTSK